MIDTEILSDFRTESLALCDELRLVVEELEVWDQDEFPVGPLKEFSQKIDRIMGMAKTLALEDPGNLPFRQIGALTELAKLIGNKAAERGQNDLVPIFSIFLGDVVSAVSGLLAGLTDRAQCERLSHEFAPVLVKRLEWLKAKVLGDSATLTRTKTELDAIVSTLLSA